jgi:type II secretory pathway component HofQ
LTEGGDVRVTTGIFALLLFFATSSGQAEEPRRISVSFDRTDIKHALSSLAEVQHKGIAFDPNVVGQVTLKLDDVEPRVAFEAIVRLKELVAEENEGVILVRPLSSSARP